MKQRLQTCAAMCQPNFLFLHPVPFLAAGRVPALLSVAARVVSRTWTRVPVQPFIWSFVVHDVPETLLLMERNLCFWPLFYWLTMQYNINTKNGKKKKRRKEKNEEKKKI